MNTSTQQARSHAPLILTVFLSSVLFLSLAGCQASKKEDTQMIEANAEALLDTPRTDTEWLKGRKLCSIDSIIGDQKEKRLIYIFNFFDCQTCVKEGFTAVRRIEDSVGKNVVKVIASRTMEVTSTQRQNQYKGYIYIDEKDRIRKELKYAPTPMLLIIDDSCKIEDAFIFDTSGGNTDTLKAFIEKCISKFC